MTVRAERAGEYQSEYHADNILPALIEANLLI
jgi:hypothetical protein